MKIETFPLELYHILIFRTFVLFNNIFSDTLFLLYTINLKSKKIRYCAFKLNLCEFIIFENLYVYIDTNLLDVMGHYFILFRKY